MNQQKSLQPITGDVIEAYQNIHNQLKGNSYPAIRLIEMLMDEIHRIGRHVIANYKVTKTTDGRSYDLGRFHLVIENQVAVQVYCIRNRLGDSQRRKMRTLLNESNLPAAILLNFGAGSYDVVHVENQECLLEEWNS